MLLLHSMWHAGYNPARFVSFTLRDERGTIIMRRRDEKDYSYNPGDLSADILQRLVLPAIALYPTDSVFAANEYAFHTLAHTGCDRCQ